MELCAYAGISPTDPVTPAEAYAMGKARDRAAWEHTSRLCAVVANLFRGKNEAPILPSAFNPYRHDEPKAERPKGLDHSAFVALIKKQHSRRRGHGDRGK